MTDKIISLNEIRELVADIRKQHNDDETAHFKRDSLYIRVLRTIASGVPNAQELAAAALVVEKIRFSRWYA